MNQKQRQLQQKYLDQIPVLAEMMKEHGHEPPFIFTCPIVIIPDEIGRPREVLYNFDAMVPPGYACMETVDQYKERTGGED